MGEIIVRIAKTKDAAVEFEGQNFKGATCTAEIEKLLSAVGGRTIDRKAKPELVKRVAVGRVRVS